MLEADLAARYTGIDGDLLSVWRPGSGMTLRRLYRLVIGLPADARIWAVVEAEQKKALKPTLEQLRERQAHYSSRAN